jgi:hypothetical protein
MTKTAHLTDISGQYSYVLHVSFASMVGSGTPPISTLQLNNVTTL